MTKKHYTPKSRSSQALQTIPLLNPGSQGWSNPQINEMLLKSGSLDVTLTTKQVEERFGIQSTNLRSCHINEVFRWKSDLILHEGRDRWKIYTEATV